ncbi:MAG: PorV/PorQ family protein [candidate division KSB1 bacterium]|nr:PorV/PorQ family protein [candidate division KSB1 bacterium]
MNLTAIRNKLKTAGRCGLLTGLLFLLAAVPQSLQAQTVSGVGTTAASFLKIGVGARALGMGEAYTTQATDVTALYWNPGALDRIDNIQMVFNHFDYLADIYFEYFGAAVPIQNLGTFGISFSYLGMPDMERTTVMSPDGNGEMVSAHSYAVNVGFARALTDRFAIGGNVKYVGESIWHAQATGFAFDVGLLYRALFRNVKIGMSITNFGTDMSMQGRDMLIQHDISEQYAGNNENINAYLDTDGFPMPVLFRVGLSANIGRDFFNLEKYDWIVAVDAVHPNDNREYLNVGTEIDVWNALALRTGYRQLFLKDREGGFTFGFGVRFNILNTVLNLDYANVDYGRLDHHNKFSLLFSF